MELGPFYSPVDVQLLLAEKIKLARKQKGWTQKEMAKRADIPLSTYARIEQLGEGSLRHLAKILTVLGRADELEKILIPYEKTPVEEYEEYMRKKRKNRK